MEYNQPPLIAYLMIALAASLWGGIGIFVEYLNSISFSSLQIVALRVISATFFLYIYLRLRKPDRLRIQIKHAYFFVGTGILSICFFNWSYFTAIRETSLSIAVVLLYTGPAFVVIMSRFWFNEKFTIQKITALLFTFIGTMLVSGFIPGGSSISLYGLFVGFGAGFGYALYSIFSKVAMKYYSPLTIIFYTFLFASIFMIPVSGLFSSDSLNHLTDSKTILMILGLGLFPTVFAYLLYTEGLKRIEAGKAAITAMAEPVTATLLGVFIFGEILSLLQLIGIMIVLCSVILIHVKRGKLVRI